MKSKIFSLILIVAVAFCMMPVLGEGAFVSAAQTNQSATTVPKAVLSSVQRSGDYVQIKWNAVSGAEGYELSRSINNGAFKRLGSTTNLQMTDKTVAVGNTYTYHVRAYKVVNGKHVHGKYSDTRSITMKQLTRWQKLMEQYRYDSKVDYLIFIKHTTGANAKVKVYRKAGSLWYKKIDCKGWVGKNGIDKTKEGDLRTPTGTFNITQAFGIKSKPQTTLKYLKVTKYHYWCGEKAYYNQLVDTSKVNHQCKSGVCEHLIDYKGAYDYGLFLDFNKEGTYKKGSAIFMHCTTNYAYTSGCISVDKNDMLSILKLIDSKTKICIYDEK